MSLDDVNTDGATEGDSAPPQTPPEQTGQIAALQAERAKRQAVQAKLDAMVAEQANAETTAAEQRGEFERLYTAAAAEVETLTAYKTAAVAKEDSRVEALEVRNAARVAKLPEYLQPLVSSGDADTVSAWLDKAAGAQPETAMPAGTRSTAGDAEGIPDACTADAVRRGKDPKQWLQTWRLLPAGIAHYAQNGGAT